MARKKKAKKKKTTRKKTTAKRKTTKRKTTKAKKKKPATKVAKKATTREPCTMRISASDRPRTKSQIFNILSEDTGLSRKEVGHVFQSLEKTIAADMGNRGPKIFTVPNLMKITCKRKPARKARKGINPFTGEEMMFKAKPASNVVKIRPLKKLKEMV